jgi:hypothetical protein
MTDRELILKAVVLSWARRTWVREGFQGQSWLIVELGHREFVFEIVAGFPTIDDKDREALLVELAGREEQ